MLPSWWVPFNKRWWWCWLSSSNFYISPCLYRRAFSISCPYFSFHYFTFYASTSFYYACLFKPSFNLSINSFLCLFLFILYSFSSYFIFWIFSSSMALRNLVFSFYSFSSFIYIIFTLSYYYSTFSKYYRPLSSLFLTTSLFYSCYLVFISTSFSYLSISFLNCSPSSYYSIPVRPKKLFWL